MLNILYSLTLHLWNDYRLLLSVNKLKYRSKKKNLIKNCSKFSCAKLFIILLISIKCCKLNLKKLWSDIKRIEKKKSV